MAAKCMPSAFWADFALETCCQVVAKCIFGHFCTWDMLPGGRQVRFRPILHLGHAVRCLPSAFLAIFALGTCCQVLAKCILGRFCTWDMLPGACQVHFEPILHLVTCFIWRKEDKACQLWIWKGRLIGIIDHSKHDSGSGAGRQVLSAAIPVTPAGF